MANKTIPDLTAGSAVGAADLFEASQSAASVKITAAQLLTYVSANLDATLVAVAGVTFAANKGLYATGADAFTTYDLTAGGRALGGVAGTADTFPYFSASNTVTLGSITSAGRALLDDADAAAQRTTLGLVIGTNVQAYDAELAAIAGLTSAADRVPYFTGSGTAALATFTAGGRALGGVAGTADTFPYFSASNTVTLGSITSAGRALLDDADAAAQRTTLGLVIGTNVQAYDAELAAIAGLTSAADRVPYFTGSGTAALATFTAGGRALAAVAGTADTFPYFSASNVVTLGSVTAFGRSLMDDADAATARTTLGLVIGTNVQAYDADLQAIAALTSAADKLPYSTGAGTWALADLTAAARTLLAASTVAAQQAALGVNPSRIDPTNPTITVDEFEFASTETGEIGEMGWGFTNGTFNLVNPESGHPGTCRRASTAVAATVASVFPGGGGATPTHRFEQIDEQTWIIKPVTADTDFDLRFGWSSDFTSATATNGVYFEKLAADTNWFGVSRTAGSQTRTDLGVAFAASWFKLRLRRIDASTVGFSINGGSETTITATIPAATNVLLFGFHIIPQSANARSVDVDWYGHRLVAQSR